MKNQDGQFIHERYPSLNNSQDVNGVVSYLQTGGEVISNNPADRLSHYLSFLANPEYVNDGILTGNQSSIDRQIEAHVIKAEDVPEGYFELQIRIAREQGHGDLEIDEKVRDQLIETIQTDQRTGLKKWVEYLGGADGGYPDWFKMYSFNSVVKLGKLDKERGEFQKRSKGTTSPYPELDREALAHVYDAVNKAKIQKQPLEGNDAEFEKMLEGANFGKLYAHSILMMGKTSPELLKSIDGSWKTFNQTRDPRTARRLSESLEGHGTGWCVAGESMAELYLAGGDFYVYYTQDEKGRDVVPRVAIRMEGGEVAEVRGINPQQELEPDLDDITSERLKSLPGGEIYIKRVEDMKHLTAIDKMIHENPTLKLSDEDVSFLYEIDYKIEGFGYVQDPRIAEIRLNRGSTDKPEISRLFGASFREQLDSRRKVFEILKAISGQELVFNANMSSFESQFAKKNEEWLENGTYDFLAKEAMENDTRYLFMAVPNEELNIDQIRSLANEFGELRANIGHHYSHFSGQELSGVDPDGGPIRFILMRKRNEVFSLQSKYLKDIEDENPTIKFRLPSVLDAIAYWYTLRETGVLGENKTDLSEQTYIRNGDLRAQIGDGYGDDGSWVEAVMLVSDNGRIVLDTELQDYRQLWTERIEIL